MATKRGRPRKEAARPAAGLRITVDVFSGRENPVIELSGAQLNRAVKGLKPRAKTGRAFGAKLPPIPTLGYRGLQVEQVGEPLPEYPRAFRVADGQAFGPDFALPLEDEAFEDFVCGSVPRTFPIDDIRKEILGYRSLLDFWRHWRWEHVICPKLNPCHCAPLYEPGWWNVPARQPHNNCYNYASNYRTDTFAQPGRAAGAMYTALQCPEVRAGAIADMLIDSPGADNRCPDEGHLVALVIWPGADFHWYRKGRDGSWSHKPGGTAVTNLDNSGNPITDPRTANRGNYSVFCTFMTVMHGHIKIS